MGLAVAGLLIGHQYLAASDESRPIESRRTYFGLLRVMTGTERARDREENDNFYEEPLPPELIDKEGKKYAPPYPFTYLMHGTTYHGRNYTTDTSDPLRKNRKDLSRLATTYYHRYGPVGIVMEQYNWFKGAQNTFRADLRMPASLIGQLAAPIGVCNLPIAALVELQSEPPYATIGLGTGTMASYARPYQHMTYYEIDDVIREFSLPDGGGKAHFTYLQNAIKRGVCMEVIMGDARQSLEYKREKNNRDNSYLYTFDFAKGKFEEPIHTVADKFPNRDGYYKVINVDAFSSDAIPVHLCTKQALKLYMDKLTYDGVLCMHTSNRHMDLVIPVARIAMELSKESVDRATEEVKKDEDQYGNKLNLKTDKERDAYIESFKINCRVGKDGRERYMGHFSSEYVMLYRGEAFGNYLEALRKEKSELIRKKEMQTEGKAPDGKQILNSVVDWYDPLPDHKIYRRGREIARPITKNDSVWTDDFSHVLSVLR